MKTLRKTNWLKEIDKIEPYNLEVEVEYLDPEDVELDYCDTEVFFVDSPEADTTNDWQAWNKTLASLSKNEGSITQLLSSFKNCKTPQKTLKKHGAFFAKADVAYNSFLKEKKECSKKVFPEPSAGSFLQLLRFLPEYPEKNIEVFVDEKTGFFGLTIRIQEKGNSILNLVMDENREIIFSFIKRNQKINKISGRAFFNDHLEDSPEIRKIFQLLKE